MEIINDSISRPFTIVINNDTWIGAFYYSHDGLHHLAEYMPYGKVATSFLCGQKVPLDYVMSRDVSCNKCQECWAVVRGMVEA